MFRSNEAKNEDASSYSDHLIMFTCMSYYSFLEKAMSGLSVGISQSSYLLHMNMEF
jgi:hypothetical protein